MVPYIVVNMELFRPSPEQTRLFARIRDFICTKPAGLADAASLIIALTEERAQQMQHAANQTFARLLCFVQVASKWDLSHYGDRERRRRGLAILYVTWLMTDADATSRAVNASKLEGTPMRPPDSRAAEEDMCLDRGWAKWAAFGKDKYWHRDWLTQIQIAWDEHNPTPNPLVAVPNAQKAVSSPPPLTQNALRVARVLVRLRLGEGLIWKDLATKSGVPPGSLSRALSLLEPYGLSRGPRGAGYYVDGEVNRERLAELLGSPPATR